MDQAPLRRCYRCKQEFPATQTYFYRDKSKSLGLMIRCIPCEKERPRKKRPNQYRKLPHEQKARAAQRQSFNWKNTLWMSGRVSNYRQFDSKRGYENDLTVEWFMEHIQSRACHYCSQRTPRMGADRIDNNKGHTRDNVVACCLHCNYARGDRLSHEEMKIVGAAIKLVLMARHKKTESQKRSFDEANH